MKRMTKKKYYKINLIIFYYLNEQFKYSISLGKKLYNIKLQSKNNNIAKCLKYNLP